MHIQDNQPLLLLADQKQISLPIKGYPKQSIDSYAREWAIYELSKDNLRTIVCANTVEARLSGESRNATFEIKRQVIDYWKRFYREHVDQSRPDCDGT